MRKVELHRREGQDGRTLCNCLTGLQVTGLALGITRGSVVCTPLTSFQIWTSAAFKAAPMTVAVRSEPSLPRVVMIPLLSCRSIGFCRFFTVKWAAKLLGNISCHNRNVGIVVLQRPQIVLNCLTSLTAPSDKLYAKHKTPSHLDFFPFFTSVGSVGSKSAKVR